MNISAKKTFYLDIEDLTTDQFALIIYSVEKSLQELTEELLETHNVPFFLSKEEKKELLVKLGATFSNIDMKGTTRVDPDISLTK